MAAAYVDKRANFSYFVGRLLFLLMVWVVPAHAASLLIGGEESFEGTLAQLNARWPATSVPGGVAADGNNTAFMSQSSQFSLSGTSNLRMNFCGSQIADGGHPACSGGNIERSFTAPSTDNWTTVTIYWEPGFLVSGSHDNRLPCNNQPLWTCGSGLKWGPYMRGAGNQLLGWMFGSRQISGGCQGCYDAHIPSIPWTTPGVGHYSTWNLYQNQGNNFTMPDAHHVCYEHHIKLNDPGVANGIIEVWVTDLSVPGFVSRRIIYYPGLEIRGPVSDGAGAPNPYNATMTAIQLYRQDSVGVAHYDLFDVTTARKGCPGSVLPVDATPPAPPKNLRKS